MLGSVISMVLLMSKLTYLDWSTKSHETSAPLSIVSIETCCYRCTFTVMSAVDSSVSFYTRFLQRGDPRHHWMFCGESTLYVICNIQWVYERFLLDSFYSKAKKIQWNVLDSLHYMRCLECRVMCEYDMYDVIVMLGMIPRIDMITF